MDTDEDEYQDSIESPTFGKDVTIHVKEAVGSASISPSGRDIVLASPQGLHIVDLDDVWSPPRLYRHRQPWAVADVQWSPFGSCDYRIASTSGQTALVWNLNLPGPKAPIEHALHAHSRAITDINFSAHDPDLLATCGIDSFVHCWDLRTPRRPAISFADWTAGASQVKWNRQDQHILASSHDRNLRIWDNRRGATPVRTIPAHNTKIYGLDWNRTSPNRILTCSLDASIKLWDLSDPEDYPMRTIRTSYPVFRARHTPFGMGILAMPQRDSNDLHLYDRRLREGDRQEEVVEPVHVFSGHKDSVKEFLWRSWGTVEYNVDSRDFQLVSWGTDNNLCLHHVDESVFRDVAFRKGQEAAKRTTLTRKGARYRTFRISSRDAVSSAKSKKSIKSSKRLENSASASISVLNLWRGAPISLFDGNQKHTSDPIDWMKGVNVGENISGSEQMPLRSADAPPFSTSDSLGDEIKQVGKRFKSVLFEYVDVPARFAILSADGPWGADSSVTHLKASLSFPKDYPASIPTISIEKTPSISEAAMTRLSLETKAICEAYVDIGRGSLEALIAYLLGDTDLDSTIAWVSRVERAMQASLERLDDSSSDDEDEGLVGVSRPAILQQTFGVGAEQSLVVNTNANVPLPKGCGAIWTEDGRLLCFFPKKDEVSLLLRSTEMDNARGQLPGNRLFDSLGWLGTAVMPRKRSSSSSSDSSSDSSADSSESSASSTVSQSEGVPSVSLSIDLRPGGLMKMSALRSTSQQSVTQITSKRKPDVSQQTISLQNHDDLLPSKRFLAEEYRIWGGRLSEICSHNAEVASRHQMEDISAVWKLVALLVEDNVPLKVLPQSDQGQTDILIIARRSVTYIKRKDSGLDLTFDDPPSVTSPILTAAVQWGQSPLGSEWLVQKLFAHFQSVADVQMLAMLACILSDRQFMSNDEHQVDGVSLGGLSHHLDTKLSCLYYASEELAINPTYRQENGSDSQDIGHNMARIGSFDGYEEVWSSDETEVDHKSSYSDHLSPPLMSRENSRHSVSGQSLSSSPEEHRESMRRSHSMLSTRLAASFSRPFSFMTASSASPPSQPRTPELSTSAPSGAGSGIQFTKHDTANLPRVDSRSGLAYELDVSAVDDSDSDASDDLEVYCTYKNTEQFDGAMRAGFLTSFEDETLRGWREMYAHMLYVWQLPIARAEVLKFNGAETNNDFMPEINGKFSGDTKSHQSATTQKVFCTICYEFIGGLHHSCLHCGHSIHIDCMESLGDDWDEELGCEAGCGCHCSGAQSIEEVSISEATMSTSKETISGS